MGNFRHKVSRPRSRILAAVALLFGTLSLTQAALAVHDEGFALQGDVHDATLFDWDDLFDVNSGVATPKAALPDSFVRAAFRRDFVTTATGAFDSGADLSAYATGTKDELPINLAGQGDWQCKQANNVGDKFNLLNAYAAAMIPNNGGPADGDLIVYFGSEIAAPEGNRSAGLWLLQDKTVDCNSPGGNTDWTGHHRDGDVFIVSAFTGGGNDANIDVYEWVDSSPGDGNGDIGGSLVLKFSTGDLNNARCDSGTINDPPILDRACAIENGTAEVNPDWDAPDKSGGDLDVHTFFEGAVNLSALGLDTCFATGVANSRSSQETGSTLHDFARMDFNTCGTLKVHKFVDLDGDGNDETATADPDDPAGRWSFSVTGPSCPVATPCTGTTDANGDLVFSSMEPGTYTITETQVGGFYNTKAGSTVAVNTSTTTVSTTAPVGLAGETVVTFGNICYVDKTFRINNVPTGTAAPSSITVEHFVDNNDDDVADSSAQTLALADQGGGVWSNAVNNTFLQTDKIDWRWYINGDTGNKVAGGDNDSLQAANPTTPSSNPPTDTGCQVTNSDSFDLTPVTGFKYKDFSGTFGTFDGTDTGLAGFRVNLFRIVNGVEDANPAAFAVSDANGVLDFGSLAPGTYRAREVQQTGWEQTQPAAGNAGTTPGSRLITITLGEASESVGNWGNTPLSNFAITFTPNAVLPGTSTPATQATISCAGNPGSQSGNTYTASNQRVGTYNCQLVITDP